MIRARIAVWLTIAVAVWASLTLARSAHPGPANPRRRLGARLARVALAALDHGSFLPRLIDPSSNTEPRLCQNCAVKEACLRGDSGARTRLERWATAARETDPDVLSAEEFAALRLFDLGAEP